MSRCLREQIVWKKEVQTSIFILKVSVAFLIGWNNSETVHRLVQVICIC